MLGYCFGSGDSPHVGGQVGHHVAKGVEGAQGELDQETPNEGK